jgi:predicted ferric reductase
MSASRYNSLASFFHLTDSMMVFHKYTSTLAMWTVTLHGLGYIGYVMHEGFTPAAISKLLKKMFLVGLKKITSLDDLKVITGLVSVLCFIWVGATTLHWIRKYNYSFFVLNHLLVVPAILIGMFHA